MSPVSKISNVDYSLIGQYKNLNDFILSQSEGKSFKNYIYFFTAPNRPKVSIICKFIKNSDKYYGLHPRITASFIKDEILMNGPLSIFSDGVLLFDFINKNQDIWQVPNNNKHSLLDKAFCAKCLLTMVSFFYFDLDLSHIEEFHDHFLQIINNHQKLCSDRFDFSFTSISPDDLKKERNKQLHRLHGRLPEVILKELDKCGYLFDFEDHHVVVYKDFEKRKNFSTLYSKDNADYLLCTSNAFYSGVNLRLKKVEISPVSSSNSQMSSLILTVERTTFGTICGFDGFYRGKVCHGNNNNIIGHPYLNRYRDALYKVIDNEINAISTLSKKCFQSIPSIDKSIEFLNDYLDQSVYPHYINVSGNVITNDNYCIYTRRGDSTTDSEALYCSVNGVSEVFDPQVDFYSQSVEEDSPTIIFPGAGNRIDFNGELSRESEAELGTSNFSSNWKYYGFSMMGYYDQNAKTIDACHFNIAAYNHVNSSFLDIAKFRENATEKFENKCLWGYQLKIYNNLHDGLLGLLTMIIQWILVWKDVLLFLLLFISSIIVVHSVLPNDFSTRINTITSTLFSICLLYVSAAKIYSNRKLTNVRVVLSRLSSLDSTEYMKITNKFIKKANDEKGQNKSHAILLLMSALYFLSEANKVTEKTKKKKE